LAASSRIPSSAVQSLIERVRAEWDGHRRGRSHPRRVYGQSLDNYKRRSLARWLELSVQLGTLSRSFAWTSHQTVRRPMALVVA
jgi:hypothetical protein